MSQTLQITAFKERLAKRSDMLAALLKRMNLSPEAYERLCLNALTRNPDLAKCDLDSFDLAIIECAEAGLIPDNKQAALVPFQGEIKLMPMITGRLMLARRATPGIAIRAKCIYDGDEYEYREGLRPTLDHWPAKDAIRTPENIIAAYASARVPGSAEPEFELLWKADIELYKARSAAVKRGRSSPWDTDYGEMAEKTVLGLLLKRLPTRPDDPVGVPEINYMDWEGGPIVDGEATPEGGDPAGEDHPQGPATRPAGHPAEHAKPETPPRRSRRRAAARPPAAEPAKPQTQQQGSRPGGSPFEHGQRQPAPPQTQQQEQDIF